MKHISKFDVDGYEYVISYSMADDITLIWRDILDIDFAYKNDIPPRELIGWYFGEYDFDITEEYIKDYYKNMEV